MKTLRRLSDILEFPSEKCGDARMLIDARDYYLAFCRAALVAETTVLIAGWQFDTEVELVRGSDKSEFDLPLQFIEFLNHLCERKAALQVYILAWDYSSIYALEREWFQGLKLHAKARERIHFCYWTHPEPGGSFHQKFVVIDAHTAFLGGLDICDSRYDDREHRLDNALRVDVAGRPSKPFHDIQLALSGPVAAKLAEMFFELWTASSDVEIKPWWRDVSKDLHNSYAVEQGLVLRCSTVGLSRTVCLPNGASIGETRDLFCAAIDAAENLIYLENQYFTSKDILLAFKKRLEDPDRSRLTIVMIMPEAPDNQKEEFVLGNRQDAVRHAVAQLAVAHGHHMRLLKSTQARPDGLVSTFIHSKLMIVDDSLLICGSANLTNRSLHVDQELNACFQAGAGESKSALLREDIRQIRASLLAEHAHSTDLQQFANPRNLITAIDACCASPESPLTCQEFDEPQENDPLLVSLFDPDGPSALERLEFPLKEAISVDDNFFKTAVRRMGQRLGVFDIDIDKS